MRFFNFFVAYMVQKYQNESASIFYNGKSPKTNRKHLKIPYLQALALRRVIKMTLYKWESKLIDESTVLKCITGWIEQD